MNTPTPNARRLNVALIFAVDRNGVMGKDLAIPWHSPHDFQFFRTLTMGHAVVMGRKTWESLPDRFRPLPGRTNYVISRNPSYLAKDAFVHASLRDVLAAEERKNNDGKIFVIGGAGLFQTARNVASRAYVTHIGAETSLDGECVMAPDLPEFTVCEQESLLLFAGDAKYPSANMKVLEFKSTSFTDRPLEPGDRVYASRDGNLFKKGTKATIQECVIIDSDSYVIVKTDEGVKIGPSADSYWKRYWFEQNRHA